MDKICRDSIHKENMNEEQIKGLPEIRRKKLKELLAENRIVKALEVHSGLTGLIAEKTVVQCDDEEIGFDAMWISSLCDSAEKGRPDIELVDMSSRLHTIEEVMDVTSKPIILDGDTGGFVEHFVYYVRTLERIGVSAVIIEDKTGIKKNSLLDDKDQLQDSIEHFCEKIRAGKNACLTKDFMIIARIESLVMGKGMDDALLRAEEYVRAGADGIMIHSKKNTPDEIFGFCDAFRKKDSETPIVAVPTSYGTVTEKELEEHGINVVIYANQLIRSAVPAMIKAAQSILKNRRTYELEEDMISVKELINFIDI
ncbi:MAG: phosphoenolpyruvate mutase [Butyrivibrio sp.]